MKNKAIVKSVVGGLLSGTQVIFDGLSSARQIVDFTPAPWARYAACSATIVEGEIFRKNIVEGFSRFSLLSEKSLKKYLIIQIFEDHLTTIKNLEKGLKEKLHNFLNEIKKGNYAVKKEEKFFLEKNIDFLIKEDASLEIEKKQAIEEFFEQFKEEREGTTNFISFEHRDRFTFLNEQFNNLLKEKEWYCSFSDSYKAHQNFLEKAEFLHAKTSDIEQAENQLKLLRKMIVKSVSYPENCRFLSKDNFITLTLTNLLKDELSKKTSKLWSLRFGMLFSIGAGVASGLVAYYTFPAVLIGLGLGCLSAGILPLAILAGIAYAILIYNTITDLIINETLSKWWKDLNEEIQRNDKPPILKYICIVIEKIVSQLFNKLIHWCKRQENENWFSYGLRIILSLAVLVFGIIASLTTGYTAFTQLQGYVSLAVCVITALPLMLSDLLFTLKNSFETVGLLTGISLANLFNPINKVYIDLKKQLESENYLQYTLHLFRLPLKLLLSVFKLFIFCCHVVFTSVASDRFFNFPCWLTLVFAAGSELLTDICPLFGNKQGEHHDHDHGGIFNWIAKLIFILPATVLGVFNSLFSQLNHLFSNSDLKTLNLWEAIQQEWQKFDIRHVHTDNHNLSTIDNQPKLPEEIVLEKSIDICDKQIIRLKKGFFNTVNLEKKIDIFTEYRERLNNKDLNNKLNEDNKLSLSKQRFFNLSTKTTSARSIEKIEALLNNLATNNDTANVSSNIRAF